MLKLFWKSWKAYRHRFVPWVAVNLKKQQKRVVQADKDDKITMDETLLTSLLHLLPYLHTNRYGKSSSKDTFLRNIQILETVMGFSIKRLQSQVAGAGKGVYLTAGSVEKGTLVALYPGTIYKPFEPIFLPSIGNSFLLRCIDGIHIDGNDKRLSKMIYKSCVNRDSMWPIHAADVTWLTEYPVLPLSVGQYINNQSHGYPANVAYQELDAPLSLIAPELQLFLPNIWYMNHPKQNFIRLVALVSIRKINVGEELFSNYYTLVHKL